LKEHFFVYLHLPNFLIANRHFRDLQNYQANSTVLTMYKATLTLAVVLALALCVAASSQTAEPASESAASEPETEMGLSLGDLEDFYSDDELQSDDDQEERELTKRALPKLRRIFIGKRGTEDSSNEWLFGAKRAHPRRHLFIGKRSGDRTKKGRVHRIFIG